jgi:hypothetical protein
MINTIQEYSKENKNPNEHIVMEVTMTVVFVAIIAFSAVVLLGV